MIKQIKILKRTSRYYIDFSYSFQVLLQKVKKRDLAFHFKMTMLPPDIVRYQSFPIRTFRGWNAKVVTNRYE